VGVSSLHYLDQFIQHSNEAFSPRNSLVSRVTAARHHSKYCVSRDRHPGVIQISPGFKLDSPASVVRSGNLRVRHLSNGTAQERQLVHSK
jgi:hypothetical protein